MRILILAALLASPAFADPVEGRWTTEPGDTGSYGVVTIAPCGAAICGTLTETFDAAGKKVASDKIGTQMIWDMQAEGGGKYGGGKIYAPDREKTYRSKMALEGDRLKVSGCVGPICRSQIWTRVQ